MCRLLSPYILIGQNDKIKSFIFFSDLKWLNLTEFSPSRGIRVYFVQTVGRAARSSVSSRYLWLDMPENAHLCCIFENQIVCIFHRDKGSILWNVNSLWLRLHSKVYMVDRSNKYSNGQCLQSNVRRKYYAAVEHDAYWLFN